MADVLSQIYLYRERKKIRQEVRGLFFENWRFRYLHRFIRQHQRLIVFSFCLVCLQILIEISAPLLSRFFFYKITPWVYAGVSYQVILLLIIVLIFYLTISFFALKFENTLLVALLNDLRRRWFRPFLYTDAHLIRNEEKSSLISKITYHFSLIQLGFGQCLVNGIKIILTLTGLIVVVSFYNPRFLLIIFASLPLYLFLVFIGYSLSKYYVSQEQTLFSRIIQLVDQSIHRLRFLQKQGWEEEILGQFDNLVDLDSYFRVRRYLWLQYGGKVIFSLVIFTGALVYLAHFPFENLLRSVNPDMIGTGLILGILIKLLYNSLHVGLYFLPLKLGLILCIPEERSYYVKKKIKEEFTAISFRSRKVKLIKERAYIKNIEFSFPLASRTLFFGEKINETKLPLLFSGLADYEGLPWVVRLDRRRYLYRQWVTHRADSYYIETSLPDGMALGEIITGKIKDRILAEDIIRVENIIGRNPELSFIRDFPKKLVTAYSSLTWPPEVPALLQIARCLFNPPEIVVANSLWLDINNPDVNHLFQVLADENKSSILIFFSTRDNNLVPYTQKYYVAKDGLAKI